MTHRTMNEADHAEIMRIIDKGNEFISACQMVAAAYAAHPHLHGNKYDL